MLDLLFFVFILQLLEVGKGATYVHFSCSSFPTEAGEGERGRNWKCVQVGGMLPFGDIIWG